MKSRDRKIDFLLKRFVVGPMETNCYLLADSVCKDACLIDPGGDPEKVREFLDKNGLKLKFIVNTHGHGDHIASNGYFGVPIFIHKLDKDFLKDPAKNLSKIFIFSVTSPEASRLIEEGDKIKVGAIELDVIHTPGHTPGSVSLKFNGIIFTGDALFRGGIGRTDFPYGDEKLLLKSIEEKLLIFDDDTVIYPGHGEKSTIGIEKKMDPFII